MTGRWLLWAALLCFVVCAFAADPPPPIVPTETVIIPPCAGMPHTWHVLTVTYGGTVSLIKDLTKCEAQNMQKLLDPWNHSCNGCMTIIQPGDIKSVEIFE